MSDDIDNDQPLANVLQKKNQQQQQQRWTYNVQTC